VGSFAQRKFKAKCAALALHHTGFNATSRYILRKIRDIELKNTHAAM
jgi:hypothetical protein